MKFAILCASAALLTAVEACVRVHVRIDYQGDNWKYDVQIWDNDFYYTHPEVRYQPPNDAIYWDLPNSYALKLNPDGKSGHITYGNGRGSDLYLHAEQDDGGDRITCLNDNYGNCGSYVCGL